MTTHSLPRKRTLGLLAITLLSAESAGASELISAQSFAPVNSFDLASMGYPGVQGRVVHGDHAGDRVGAMFFLVEGEVLWSPMPYALTSAAPLAEAPTLACDLAVLPASQGDRDLLVMSTDTGLMAATYQQQTNDFALWPLAATSTWSGATQLKRRQIGVPRTAVLSGMSADGKTVQVAQVDELGATDLFSLTFPVPIMEHDLIDYDGDGAADVAVATSLGLFVFNQNGGLLRREQVATQIGGVVTFESQGSERLAFWYQAPATGLAFLRVVDGPVTEAEVPLRVLASEDPVPLEVLPSFALRGDYDGDANQDLLLQIHHLFCVLLINRAPASGPPPAAHFGTAQGDYDLIPLGADPEQPTDPGQAWACFGNIDSDPGDDLIVPVEALDRIEIHTREGPLSPGQGLVGFTSGDLVAPNSTYWSSGTTEAHLNLALSVPLEYLPGASQGFSHLQVVTWFQDGANQQLTPLGEQNSLHALVADERQWVKVEPRESGALLTGDYWPAQDNIWVAFRFVEADVGQFPPAIERASRFMIGAFTLRSSPSSQSIPPYLTSLEGAEPEVPLDLLAVPGDGGGSAPQPAAGGLSGPPRAQVPAQAFGAGGTALLGNGYVGGYVPQSFSVLFPPDSIPAMPTPVPGGGMFVY